MGNWGRVRNYVTGEGRGDGLGWTAWIPCFLRHVTQLFLQLGRTSLVALTGLHLIRHVYRVAREIRLSVCPSVCPCPSDTQLIRRHVCKAVSEQSPRAAFSFLVDLKYDCTVFSLLKTPRNASARQDIAIATASSHPFPAHGSGQVSFLPYLNYASRALSGARRVKMVYNMQHSSSSSRLQRLGCHFAGWWLFAANLNAWMQRVMFFFHWIKPLMVFKKRVCHVFFLPSNSLISPY